MATTKQTSGKNTRRRTSSSSTRSSGGRTRDDSIFGRTGRTIKERPYTSAAIATGAVTAVAAAVAGAFFFRRSDRSLAEIGEDLSERFNEGARTIKEKAGAMFSGEEDEGDTEQFRIAEEALTLKKPAQAEAPGRPDDRAGTETGAISY